MLFYREDQSIKQVSDGLGLSIAAVKQRLKRGREALRGSLTPIGAALAESRPGKAFTIGVVALIAARAGTAAAAGGAAVATSKGTAGAAAGTSWLKISALAAVVAGLAGLLYIKSRPSDEALQSPASSATAASSAETMPTLYAGDRNAPSLAGELVLRGIVVDASGNPVAGSAVTVTGDPPKVVTAGADGKFSVKGLAVTPDGASIPTAVRVNPQLKPIVRRIEPGSTIEVTVVSAEDGAPIPGANITLEAGLRDTEETTDAAGVARCRGVTEPDSFVTVQAPTFVQEGNWVLIAGEPAVYRRRFVLSKGVGGN